MLKEELSKTKKELAEERKNLAIAVRALKGH